MYALRVCKASTTTKEKHQLDRVRDLFIQLDKKRERERKRESEGEEERE